MNGNVWAVVVAAGSGSRFGRPKQFEMLEGRTVLQRSIDAARGACDGVVAVLPASALSALPGADVVVTGGATRSVSVRSGLSAVPDSAEVIVVHDGVRPLASPKLFRSVIEAVRSGADGAVPVLPLAETLKRVSAGQVVVTVDRSELACTQTPQAFRAVVLRKAHAGDPEATDDAALVEQGGGTVAVVPGETSNLKITDQTDLAVAAVLMDR